MSVAVLSVLLLQFDIVTLLLQKTIAVFVSKQGRCNGLPYILGTCSMLVVVVI